MAHPTLCFIHALRSTVGTAPVRRPLGITLLVLALGAGLLIFTMRAAPNGDPAASTPDTAANPESPSAPRTGALPNAAEPVDGEQALEEAADGEPSAATADSPAEPRRRKLLERMWWNRAKHYEPIGLDPALRARMDARLLAHLAEKGDNRRQNEAYREFRSALTDGDWELARRRIENLGTAHVAPLQRQAAMMVDIMEMLDAEQHRRLIENHAGLLAGPWISNRSIRGAGRRADPQ